MIKRYFYTDATAASWMAKHYNMRLGYYQEDKDYSFVTINDTSESGLLYSDALNGKYYVHPEDYNMLQVKIRDVAWTHTAGIIFIDDILEDGTLRVNGWSHAISGGDNVFRIIQRLCKVDPVPSSFGKLDHQLKAFFYPMLDGELYCGHYM